MQLIQEDLQSERWSNATEQERHNKKNVKAKQKYEETKWWQSLKF
jgi:hypothetical protein